MPLPNPQGKGFLAGDKGQLFPGKEQIADPRGKPLLEKGTIPEGFLDEAGF